MEDTANIVISGEEATAFLKNLNNPPESVRKARRAFLEEIKRDGLPLSSPSSSATRPMLSGYTKND